MPLDDGEEPQVHRSLLWNKDSKTGRTLEFTPIFTEGTYLYAVATQKNMQPDQSEEEKKKNQIPSIVIECYDPKNDFSFVKSTTLYKNKELETFVENENKVDFIRNA